VLTATYLSLTCCRLRAGVVWSPRLGGCEVRILPVAGWMLVVLASTFGGYIATQQFVGSRGVSHAPGRVVYLACCAIVPPDPEAILQSSYRPKSLTIDATGSNYIRNATGLEWDSAEAIAHGTFSPTLCSPACAGGRFGKSLVTARFARSGIRPEPLVLVKCTLAFSRCNSFGRDTRRQYPTNSVNQ
jgi:hypothetical protein